MDGVAEGARRAGTGRAGAFVPRPSAWRGAPVPAALLPAAFTFNTAENLPVGLLEPISRDLGVSVSAVGLLVTGYGRTVAVASLPLAHGVRTVPRRHVLTGVLGALAVSSAAAALATSYRVLLAARLLTAVAPALFWAVMGPVAVGLFAPGVRGRVVGALSVAGSLALVLGVPFGTWLGRWSRRQLPVDTLAVPALVSLATIAALLPTSRPEQEPAASALSATGAFTGYTYLVTLLGEVGGFSPGALNSLLVAFGVACLAGVPLTGAVLDRRPRSALSTAIATQAVGMLGLYALGDRPVAVVLFLMLMGGALGPVFMTTQNAMLWCAPGRTDIALGANSALYNAGIAAGAALGGLVLSLTDVRTTFLTGGLATAAAYGVLLTERLLDGRPASSGKQRKTRRRDPRAHRTLRTCPPTYTA
ncbi:MFS transporter [Streptomyces sp. NPDC001286]